MSSLPVSTGLAMPTNTNHYPENISTSHISITRRLAELFVSLDTCHLCCLFLEEYELINSSLLTSTEVLDKYSSGKSLMSELWKLKIYMLVTFSQEKC